jgi:hypothetical protein
MNDYRYIIRTAVPQEPAGGTSQAGVLLNGKGTAGSPQMLKPSSQVVSSPIAVAPSDQEARGGERVGAHSAAIRREVRRSPLSLLISEHLRANGLRQIDFCRQSGFDQGLLSKILSSVVNTLNVETALKLAEAMSLAPSVVFEAIGKKEIDEMLRRFYSKSDD